MNYNKNILSAVIVSVKEDGSIIGYSVKKPREQIDYVRKIYTVGNHAYQENYGEVDTNESLEIYNSEQLKIVLIQIITTRVKR